MRLFTRVAILFYVTVLTVMCSVVVLYVTHVINLRDVNHYLLIAYADPQSRLSVGIVSGLLIFLSFLFAKIIYNTQAKEKTIAFDNPGGRVTVSLSAIEDLVRGVILKTPEIKEVRSGIIATKKGLEVESRLILKMDVNIPEMTAQLQDMVRSKIQDTIGVDENVVVRIHVVKILTDDYSAKKNRPEGEERTLPTVPFQGYRP